jgi:hypothetical protein
VKNIVPHIDGDTERQPGERCGIETVLSTQQIRGVQLS